jgi:DNA-binding transcriptional MerR regulator
MGQALSISTLAKSTGVTSKTLRHWERVGLLPKAAGDRIRSPRQEPMPGGRAVD